MKDSLLYPSDFAAAKLLPSKYEQVPALYSQRARFRPLLLNQALYLRVVNALTLDARE